MWVNNEVGSVQPIEQIADLCAEQAVVFHTDAVQAVARVTVKAHPGISMM
jgi:cysteine desulfurase